MKGGLLIVVACNELLQHCVQGCFLISCYLMFFFLGGGSRWGRFTAVALVTHVFVRVF